jgi:hypothetical protein
MNFSSYIEDQYADELQLEKIPENKPVEAKVIPFNSELVELNEETKKDFYDFDIDKSFTGTFNGPGQTFIYNKQPVKTWSFTDRNGLPWLIPQWEILNQPQSNFLGFNKEEPGKFIYLITYLGKDDGKHNIAIYKKPVHN